MGFPLEGVRVVALEQAVAAPLCTRHLADLGADVVKIERPDGGDFARRYDSVVGGLSAYFVWLNRGKRSLTLDFKAPGGRELLDRLLAQADIVVQNMGPGVAERLDLGATALRARHPRLVVCELSGYGSSKSPCTLRTRNPCSRMARKCSPRATKLTSWPAFASSPPK